MSSASENDYSLLAPTDVDPYRLRQFVAVAESLNITRAAERLFLTQQAVSSTIKTLERDLGVTLFERSGRRIALTDAGRALVVGAVPLIDAAEALARTTRQAAAAQNEHLRIAYTTEINPDDVYDLVMMTHGSKPNVNVTMRQCRSDEMLPLLRAGEVDLTMQRGVENVPDVETQVIAFCLVRVAIETDHPLAGRDEINVAELAQETLTLAEPPGEGSFYSDHLVSICRRAGFDPDTRIVPVRGAPQTAAVVGRGGYAFVTGEPGIYHYGKVVVIPLAGEPTAPVQAMWLRHTESTLRTEMIAMALTSPELGGAALSPDLHAY